MLKKLSNRSVYILLVLIAFGVIFSFFRTAQSASSDNGPTDISITGQLVQENASNGTYIGTLSAVDPDNDPSELVFFLTSDGAGRFEIDSSNRLVQVSDGNDLLDYESQNTYDVTVVVRDPEWNTYQETFTIYVNNMNESPTNILFTGTSVTEIMEKGTVIGTFIAVDPDEGDEHIFTLTNDAGGKFGITEDTLVLIAESIQAGTYDVGVKVIDAVGNPYDKFFSVVINPIDAPISSTISTTSSSGDTTSVTWTTDKDAKSRVEYGLVSDYGKMTSYTSSFTQNQTVEMPELLDCTTYTYRVRSMDIYGKESVGEQKYLTTGGCIGNAGVVVSNQADVLTETGGELFLEDSQNKGLAVNVPENFSSHTENAHFQIQKLETGVVLQETGLPDENRALVGGAYELISVDENENKITSFDEDVRVTFSYKDSDISILTESSLRIFRWSGDRWESLSQCEVDELNNFVTCTTKHFSPFAIFGQLKVLQLDSSGKAKTIRRRGMVRENFRGTAMESGVDKSNFETVYQQSLEEVARLNEGTEGSVRVAINEEGEEVFRGYRPGKIPVEQFKKEDRPLVVYRGSSKPTNTLVKRDEDENKSLVARISSVKRNFVASNNSEPTEEEKRERMQLVTQDKIDRAKTLLEIYQIASEQMALCLENNSDMCDEIYDFLSNEVASKELSVLEELLQGSADWGAVGVE